MNVFLLLYADDTVILAESEVELQKVMDNFAETTNYHIKIQNNRVFAREKKKKQGNSVARDLPPTGSEANTTILVLYILDIDSHCPYQLSGETTLE